MKRAVAAGQILRGRLRWCAVAEGFDNVAQTGGSVFVVPSFWPRRAFRGRA